MKYIILGAGPSGLAFAHSLLAKGEDSFLVIEKEAVAGGLCRSMNVDGSPLDIGGGHFLDVKNETVKKLLFQFLPEKEWQLFNRISTIQYQATEMDYPFEANLFQLPIDKQIDFVESIAEAGCNKGLPMPDLFEEWIEWKLGSLIAKEYMLPYNKKIWGGNLDKLGTYWLYKLPNVSLRDTLKSVIEKKPAGEMPAHAKFLYPKEYGYGEVWKRMGEALGERIILNTPVTEIDSKTKIINQKYQADCIINTIPWTEWMKFNISPDALKEEIKKLDYASIRIEYHENNLETNAHWVYLPDESLEEHRILCRHNFCGNSKGYWTEINTKNKKQKNNNWNYTNEYAYPLNTIGKPESVKNILNWAKENNIIGLGRWGEWEHMNSDVAVDKGIKLANII